MEDNIVIKCVTYTITDVYTSPDVKVQVRVQRIKEAYTNVEVINFFEDLDDLWTTDNRLMLPYWEWHEIEERINELKEFDEELTQEYIDKLKKDVKRLYDMCSQGDGGWLEIYNVVDRRDK